MSSLVIIDFDHSPAGVTRRLREQFAAHGMSASEAARRYGVPQQWVSRRMTGITAWTIEDLEDFCRTLGLSYLYIAAGIRTVAEEPSAPSRDRTYDLRIKRPIVAAVAA